MHSCHCQICTDTNYFVISGLAHCAGCNNLHHCGKKLPVTAPGPAAVDSDGYTTVKRGRMGNNVIIKLSYLHS